MHLQYADPKLEGRFREATKQQVYSVRPSVRTSRGGSNGRAPVAGRRVAQQGACPIFLAKPLAVLSGLRESPRWPRRCYQIPGASRWFTRGDLLLQRTAARPGLALDLLPRFCRAWRAGPWATTGPRRFVQVLTLRPLKWSSVRFCLRRDKGHIHALTTELS